MAGLGCSHMSALLACRSCNFWVMLGYGMLNQVAMQRSPQGLRLKQGSVALDIAAPS
jgi:hypothetical protein